MPTDPFPELTSTDTERATQPLSGIVTQSEPDSPGAEVPSEEAVSWVREVNVVAMTLESEHRNSPYVEFRGRTRVHTRCSFGSGRARTNVVHRSRVSEKSQTCTVNPKLREVEGWRPTTGATVNRSAPLNGARHTSAYFSSAEMPACLT